MRNCVGSAVRTGVCYMYVTPCHFLLYSSNTIVTLTEETNRSSHSDTKNAEQNPLSPKSTFRYMYM